MEPFPQAHPCLPWLWPAPILTLMISTSWSTPLSPGKMGWPRSSSASTQPADHTSVGKGEVSTDSQGSGLASRPAGRVLRRHCSSWLPARSSAVSSCALQSRGVMRDPMESFESFCASLD